MPANRFDAYFGFSTFGESHGKAIGILIDSPPPNLNFPYQALRAALARRNIHTPYKTARQESDAFEILSGVFEGKTTGMPLCIIVPNRDYKTEDYEAIKDLFRPGHADFSWYQKYHIYDYRGGGRASGRETLARVIAGTFTDDFLGDITIQSRSLQIGTLTPETDAWLIDNPFHWAGSTLDLYKYLDEIKEAQDSVGGILQIRAQNVPAGLGDPVYEKLSANIAKAMLGIPSVKGISFGDGIILASLPASLQNDAIAPTGLLSNHQGGINGGVSNGQELVLQLIVRPVPSIGKTQKTIDKNFTERSISISGRHDICHLPRLIPVAEAMLKLCLADALAHQRLICGAANSLADYRESLDKLDEELLLLLYRRRQIVQAVVNYKEKEHLPLKDVEREAAIFAKSAQIAAELGLNEDLAVEIMQKTLRISQ